MTARVSVAPLLGLWQTDRRWETPTAKSQSLGMSWEMDPWCTIHQRFNWTNKSHLTSWLNKLPLSWSLMIYGRFACRCCWAETCASAELYPKVGTLAWVGGIEFMRFRSFPACTTMCQGAIPHVSSHKTPVSGVWAKVFQHSQAYLGYNRKSHASTCKQQRLAKEARGLGIIRGHWCMQRRECTGCQKNYVFPKKNPNPFAGWMTFQ